MQRLMKRREERESKQQALKQKKIAAAAKKAQERRDAAPGTNAEESSEAESISGGENEAAVEIDPKLIQAVERTLSTEDSAARDLHAEHDAKVDISTGKIEAGRGVEEPAASTPGVETQEAQLIYDSRSPSAEASRNETVDHLTTPAQGEGVPTSGSIITGPDNVATDGSDDEHREEQRGSDRAAVKAAPKKRESIPRPSQPTPAEQRSKSSGHSAKQPPNPLIASSASRVVKNPSSKVSVDVAKVSMDTGAATNRSRQEKAATAGDVQVGPDHHSGPSRPALHAKASKERTGGDIPRPRRPRDAQKSDRGPTDASPAPATRADNPDTEAKKLHPKETTLSLERGDTHVDAEVNDAVKPLASRDEAEESQSLPVAAIPTDPQAPETSSVDRVDLQLAAPSLREKNKAALDTIRRMKQQREEQAAASAAAAAAAATAIATTNVLQAEMEGAKDNSSKPGDEYFASTASDTSPAEVQRPSAQSFDSQEGDAGEQIGDVFLLQTTGEKGMITAPFWEDGDGNEDDVWPPRLERIEEGIVDGDGASDATHSDNGIESIAMEVQKLEEELAMLERGEMPADGLAELVAQGLPKRKAKGPQKISRSKLADEKKREESQQKVVASSQVAELPTSALDGKKKGRAYDLAIFSSHLLIYKLTIFTILFLYPTA